LTLTELIAKAYLAATGDVSTLVSSDDDYKKLLSIANTTQHDWATEPGVNWASLYDPAVSIGTVSDTDTYDLDDTIRQLTTDSGDYVVITHTDDLTSKYQIVAPEQLPQYTDGNYCARVGRTLKFNKTFASTDPEYGGEITVPAYITPDDLANATDEVVVDDPNWLVYMTAAEYVRSDIVLRDQYPNLVAKASNAMQGMKEANQPQIAYVQLSPTGIATRW
jgi:hypothetical protein